MGWRFSLPTRVDVMALPGADGYRQANPSSAMAYGAAQHDDCAAIGDVSMVITE
tara:strand:+ start:178 stop:339 length:162 start_codon:yes stop_codon:yes gene_type:complete